MYAAPDNYISPSVSLRRPLLTWSLLVVGCLAVLALIIGAPLALQTGHSFWGRAIYRSFSYVCHQIPERSFFLGEHQFAVCARCTGLYAGFALATLCYPSFRSLRQIEAPARKWLFLAAAPLALDFALGFFGLWHNTHTSRFLTGALLGAVAVFFVMPGLMDLSLRDWHRPKQAGARSPLEIAGHTGLPRHAGTTPSDYSAPDRRI
jgi:uncharacterized membrane protein